MKGVSVAQKEDDRPKGTKTPFERFQQLAKRLIRAGKGKGPETKTSR